MIWFIKNWRFDVFSWNDIFIREPVPDDRCCAANTYEADGRSCQSPWHDTLFYPDEANLLSDSHFQFSNGSRIILVHGPATPLWCCLYLDTWSSHSIVMLAVSGVIPFCWNHCTSRFTPQSVPSVLQKLLSRPIVVTGSSSVSSYLNCPIMSCFEMTTHIMHYTECKGLCSTSYTTCVSQSTCSYYWHVHRARSVFRHWTKHHQEKSAACHSWILPHCCVGIVYWSGILWGDNFYSRYLSTPS